jgi:hypothetical protein
VLYTRNYCEAGIGSREFLQHHEHPEVTSINRIHSSRSAVENAVSALKGAGFQHSNVSVLLPENLGFQGNRYRKKH